ncbi:hypothetical protein [Flavobacterium sp.]|uniref:hypothetical protein n=1 Tax=Flavobacterium sp. TaxID=239 RepID=UPI00286D8863|nr:hypothetical protein [Flavobacterium sp.]
MRNIVLTILSCLFNFLSSFSQEIKFNGNIAGCKSEMNVSSVTTNFKLENSPQFENIKDGFQLFVDPKQISKDFVSIEENYFKEMSQTADTTYIHDVENWSSLPAVAKLNEVKKEKMLDEKKADSIHAKNNQDQQIIWLINNSPEIVSIPTVEGTPILILQAIAEDGKWYPIQYWAFGRCGNGNSITKFKPEQGLRLISEIPKGTFKTKLRYRTLSLKKFYYSNEFESTIDKCAFIFNECLDCEGSGETRYLLDELIAHWEQ